MHLCKRRTLFSLTNSLTSTSATRMERKKCEPNTMKYSHCLRCVASPTLSRSGTPTEFFWSHYNLDAVRRKRSLHCVRSISRESKTHTKNATKNFSVLFPGSGRPHRPIDQLCSMRRIPVEFSSRVRWHVLANRIHTTAQKNDLVCENEKKVLDFIARKRISLVLGVRYFW